MLNQFSFKSSFSSLAILLTVFTVGCTQSNQSIERAGIDPLPERKASALIADSFAVEAQAKVDHDLAVDQAQVEIKKSALGKEFLFSSNILMQVPTPMFSNLQSRVVSFVLKNNSVYLLDVTKNFNVGLDNIPQNLLIAQFEVLKDKGDSVVIDFNSGMKRIFTTSDFFTSDDPDYHGPEFKLPLTKVTLSYLDEIKMQGEALFIRQIAQVESLSEKQNVSALNVEVRYQIKPYLPDPTFKPVLSQGVNKVGFFEANPLLLKDGSPRIYAMKWHDAKPIVFAISANTPEKYRDLVRAGILYWNKVLGANKLQVIQLTEKSITAPTYNYNIIQWAEFDAAGYAFADAHIDPRSGEVTSAQIFLPTAFTEASVAKRVRLIAGDQEHSGQARVGLKGFKTARVCERNVYKELGHVDLTAIKPEALDKAMRDYVYEVIAHEMGHVLGLRHNFAGNLIANYDTKERPELILSYYKNMKAPEGIVTSSSVMEYSRFEESAINGDMLQRPDTKALVYDDMAMRFLYQGIALPETGRAPFCTDYHLATYADCNMNDAGRSVVSSAADMYQFNLDTMAARIINLYVSKSKLGDAAGQVLAPVSEVNLDAKKLAAAAGNDLAKLVSLFKTNVKFIAVRSPFLPIMAPKNAVMELKDAAYLQSEVQRLGGLSDILKAVPQDYAAQLEKRFTELLQNPYYNSGTLRDGSSYSFSESEKEIMREQVALFAQQFQDELILNEVKALSGENFSFAETYGQGPAEEKAKWADSEFMLEYASVLLNRFKYYAFTHSGVNIATDKKSTDGEKARVELPLYYFSNPIRLAAAHLFSNPGVSIDFAYVEKKSATAAAEAELKLIGEEEKIDKASLSKEALKWLLINKKIESTLSE